MRGSGEEEPECTEHGVCYTGRFLAAPLIPSCPPVAIRAGTPEAPVRPARPRFLTASEEWDPCLELQDEDHHESEHGSAAVGCLGSGRHETCKGMHGGC